MEDERQLNKISKGSASMHLLLVMQGGVTAEKAPSKELDIPPEFQQMFVDVFERPQGLPPAITIVITKLRLNLGQISQPQTISLQPLPKGRNKKTGH